MIAGLILGVSMALTLPQAVQAALDNNIPYKIAQAEVRRAAGEVVATRAASFPTLSVSDAHQTLSKRAIPQIGPYQLGNATVDQLAATAQWTIYSGGAVNAAQGNAAAQFAATVGRYAAARNDVIAATTREYYALAAARQDAAIAATNVTVAHQNVVDALQRFEAGVAPRADVLREQLDEANARSGNIDAANAVRIASALLAHRLHLTADSDILVNDPFIAPAERYNRAQLGQQAQRLRPELRAAQAAVDAATFAVRAARAAALPQIALTATESNTHPAPFGAAQPQLAATLAATWRIFDGGAARGNVAAARASVDEAGLQLAQLRDDVDLEIERSYDDYTTALARVEAAQASVRYADETLRLASVRYKAGVGTALELSDARQSNAAAHLAVIDAISAAKTAQAALIRASGTSP